MDDTPKTTRPYIRKQPKKLTLKEERFVQEVTRTDKSKPNSLTEAYITAYEPKTEHRYIMRNEASKVFNRPHVQEAINRIKTKAEIQRQRTMKSTVTLIEQSLWDVASNAKRDSDKVAALRVLASLVDPKAIEKEGAIAGSAASKEELVAQLQETLAKALGEPTDITPDDVTPEDTPESSSSHIQDTPDPQDDASLLRQEDQQDVPLLEPEILDPE